MFMRLKWTGRAVQHLLCLQLNILEHIVISLPALVIFADAWRDFPIAAVAAFWPLGRALYTHRDYQSADRRGLGFRISFLS